ncbi:PTS transporter subunit EIIC [Wenjunlia vitaminophila]|uniref:PTS transporter subunit EIIC n=1 Tax=Wenjunlia vitaminophila TaxID=76728 RepID=UPI000A3EBF18|nr:PTS transporter subunit EIIC [Wenjunlia vitaminophila]
MVDTDDAATSPVPSDPGPPDTGDPAPGPAATAASGPPAAGPDAGTTATRPSPARGWRSGLVRGLQKVGRSLQLPIAVLPAAGLLVGLGQPGVLGAEGLGWNKVAEVFTHAGNAILDPRLTLPLLFCVGVAIGFARKADGTTALAAVVGFLAFHGVLEAFPDDAGEPQNPSVLGGILLGLVTAVVWQRSYRVKLVDWLGFFNGRRLVPILMAFIGTALGVVFGLVWEPVGDGISSMSDGLIGLGPWGAGIFGAINRALIPVGMHQFVNTFAWFEAGSFDSSSGQTVRGDLTRFLAGDPDAGMFMGGFFPIMMFALPAAALAIAHCARPERRKAVTGMMLSFALTSFVTGVTEPLEFSFMFVAPVLYAIHALLTGLSLAVTWALDVHVGFSFSGGLIDYLVNWHLGQRQWVVVPIGLGFAALYYVVFRLAIVTLDLHTPGREPAEDVEDVTRV